MFRSIDCSRRCSAGYSFFVVWSNGKIGRCWFHGDERCGDIRRGTIPLQDSQCNDRTCAYECEGKWVTIWEGSKIERGECAPSVDNPFNPQVRRVNFQIILSNGCNYRCAYCIAASNRIAIAEDKKTWRQPQEWIAWLAMLQSQYDSSGILFAGGEPTVYPGFADIALSASRLNGEHTLITNLSNPKALVPFEDGRITNFNVYASAHPTNNGFDVREFTLTLSRIKRFNHVGILMVDNEYNEPYADDIKRAADNAGIHVRMQQDIAGHRERNARR